MKTNLGVALAASLLLTLTTACTPKGEITSDSSSSVTGSIFVTKVYPTSEGESWTPIKQSTTFFVKGTSLTIQGTCTRGVDKIKVGESGVGGPFYTEVASCQNDGTFTWTKNFTSPIDTTKPLSLVAFDITDAAITDATDSVSAHVDDVVPPDPTITSPNPDPYNGASPTYAVTGTVGGDAVRVVGAYSTSIATTTSFSQNVTLTPGQSHIFNYKAYDLAGNNSPGVDVQIDWNPSISLLVYGNFTGGGAAVDVGTATGFTYETALGQFTLGTHSSTVGPLLLDTGFNFVTNSARQ